MANTLPHDNVIPFRDSDKSKKEQVAELFDSIAPRYDLMNRFLSARIDVSWRKKAIRLLGKDKPAHILDIATGTGDMAIMAAKLIDPQQITGIDISAKMLEFGRKKVEKEGLGDKIQLHLGDSETINFADNTFDGGMVAFGVRNFEHLEKGLSEIMRVLKPNGVFVILETSVPTKFPFKQGYYFYTKNILPLIGKLFSKDKVAYSYLSESASVFPHGEALNNILRKVGFIDVKHAPQTFGAATIYSASKK